MINMEINGKPVSVKEGSTVLEAAMKLGIEIPTLCWAKDVSPYGACRLCVVEIGEEPRMKMVSSCTYPAEEGLKVQTETEKVVRTRKMMLELFLGSCPEMERVKEYARQYGVKKSRFKTEREDCLLCGLCVRRSREKGMGRIVAFRGRGADRSIGTPYDDDKPGKCRPCGQCAQ